MNTTRSSRLPSLLVVVVAAASLFAGCETAGVHGNLTFGDLTARHDIDIDNPLATGAEMVIRVSCSRLGDLHLLRRRSCDEGEPVTAAESLDPDNLEVLSFSGNEVRVRALAAGTGGLHAEMGGLTDMIALVIEDMDHAEVAPAAFSRFADFPLVTLAPTGFAVLDDSVLEVFTRMETADGSKMTGFDLVEWTIAPEGIAELDELQDVYGDIRVLRPLVDSGDATISAGGANWDFSVVTIAEVADLRVFDAGPEALYTAGETVTLSEDDGLVMHLAAYTADGRYVYGQGAPDLQVTVADTAVADVVELDADGASEFDEFISGRSRGWLLVGRVAGTTEMTVAWADLSVTVTLEVQAAELDDDSDDDAEGGGEETASEAGSEPEE